jgi:hypothetical protein
MQQRLDATFLRPGPFARATAIGFCAVASGAGIFLAAWGISFLWRYTPPQIAVRIQNPELHVTQDKAFTVTQEKPFSLAQPDPLKIAPGQLTVNTERALPTADDRRTPTGELIRREVTVFSNVKHGPGVVVTGWTYSDGGGSVPQRQYCYYTASNIDHSSTRIDIASNGARASHVSALLVPDLEGALAKCLWWQA